MNTPIHVIDFEGSTKTGIIEYGVVTMLNGDISTTYTGLCKPRCHIPELDLQLHNIRNEDVSEKDPFEDQLDFFRNLRQTGPLGAHHAITENSLIKVHAPYPAESPDFLSPPLTLRSWGPWIDSLQLFKYFYPKLGSYKLMDLIETFHLAEELDIAAVKYCPETRRKPHCALYDALASVLLLKHLITLPHLRRNPLKNLLILSAPSVQSKAYLNQLTLSI